MGESLEYIDQSSFRSKDCPCSANHTGAQGASGRLVKDPVGSGQAELCDLRGHRWRDLQVERLQRPHELGVGGTHQRVASYTPFVSVTRIA